MDDLRGHVAVVTGGGSGIGRATALSFSRLGVSVAILDNNFSHATETVDQIEADGGSAFAVAVNVAAEEEVDQAFAAVMARYNRIDHAFNSAGVRHDRIDVADLSYDTWRRVIDVNLSAVFLCVRAELRAMVPQRRGTIVNVASIFGLVGRIKTAAYTASKHAIVGLTKTAALEVAQHGIRVNAVAPGFTATPMTVDLLPGGLAAAEQALGPSIPLGRLATPEQIAAAAVWLSSSASSYVTGHTLPVDGGFTAP